MGKANGRLSFAATQNVSWRWIRDINVKLVPEELLEKIHGAPPQNSRNNGFLDSPPQAQANKEFGKWVPQTQQLPQGKEATEKSRGWRLKEFI